MNCSCVRKIREKEQLFVEEKLSENYSGSNFCSTEQSNAKKLAATCRNYQLFASAVFQRNTVNKKLYYTTF